MNYSTTFSRVLRGLSAVPVRIEARVFHATDESRAAAVAKGTVGPSRFRIQGLPKVAARELRVRVESSIAALTCDLQDHSIDVVISPELDHADPGLDLPVAVAVCVALWRARSDASAERLPAELQNFRLTGELALDGRLRRIRGALPLVAPISSGAEWIAPAENGPEVARTGRGIHIGRTLLEVLDHLSHAYNYHPRSQQELPLAVESPAPTERPSSLRELTEPHQRAVGQILEAADGGKENAIPAVVLLIGPPGAGKTVVARAVRDELDPLSAADDLDVSCVYSAAGLLEEDGHLRGRPFRAPHHTVSEAGLVGGGSHPRPGEVSLAHRGVLFLDEFPEFRAGAVESLARALRRGHVELVRQGQTIRFPARPAVVIASANRCPCGFRGHPTRKCTCSDRAVAHQKALIERISNLTGIQRVIELRPIDLTTLRRADV